MKNFWRATFARVGNGAAMQFWKKPSVPASQVGGLRSLLFVKQPLSGVVFSGNGSDLIGSCENRSSLVINEAPTRLESQTNDLGVIITAAYGFIYRLQTRTVRDCWAAGCRWNWRGLSRAGYAAGPDRSDQDLAPEHFRGPGCKAAI